MNGLSKNQSSIMLEERERERERDIHVIDLEDGEKKETIENATKKLEILCLVQ